MFQGDGNACRGCRRFLAAFYFAGVKVVRRFIRFQSGGDGNGYFAMLVCGGFRCIRIVTVQVERIFPGGVVHFRSFRLQIQLPVLCIQVWKILQVWGAEITVSHEEHAYFISCIQGGAFNDIPADSSLYGAYRCFQPHFHSPLLAGKRDCGSIGVASCQ